MANDPIAPTPTTGPQSGETFSAPPRPEDMNHWTALAADAQIVKYWYVGEVARAGKLDKELDEDLLARVIRATVGQTLDFNGHGQVLVPRGMDEGAFADAARRLTQEALTARGLWNPQRRTDDYDLVSLGGNRYMVTLGNEPAGNPST